MTLPDERYRAVQSTRVFLTNLMDAKKIPKIPREIRRQAHGLLRHYPTSWDLDRLAEKSPDVIIQEMEPLTRLVMSYDEDRKDTDPQDVYYGA